MNKREDNNKESSKKQDCNNTEENKDKSSKKDFYNSKEKDKDSNMKDNRGLEDNNRQNYKD